MLPPAIADGWLSIHLSLTYCFRYVEVSDREELIFFAGGLVDSADWLAPCREAVLGAVYLEAFTLPLFPRFKDGEIVQLLVVDTKECVDALFCSVLGT